ncbi:MAG: PQQ-binding-like beta-propeller repeat protein, partial [Pseudomonadales bacterium]
VLLPKSTAVQALTTVLLFCSLAVSTTARAEGPLWSSALSGEVEWSRLTPAGSLIIAGDNYVSHINTRSGEQLWSRDKMHNLGPFNIRFAGTAPVMVVSQLVGKMPMRNRLQVLDLASGETLWDTGVRNGINLGGYTVPGKDLVLFVRESTGERGVKNGTYISAHRLSTGELKWDTRLGGMGLLPTHMIDDNGFVSGMDLSGHPEPIITDDTLYLVAGDIRSISMADGTVNWHYKLKGSVPNLKHTYAQPVLDNGTLYAAGSNRIVALNAATGEEIWSTRIGKAAIPELHLVDDRIVGRLGGTFSTGKKMQQVKPFGAFVVDKQSGALLWQWKKARESITNLAIFPKLDQIVLADKNFLYVLQLTAQKPTVVRKEKLEFKRAMGTAEAVSKGIGAVGGFLGGGLAGGFGGVAGGGDRRDPPLDISQVENSVVVRGQYHVLAHDLSSGRNTWSIEFAPPGVNPFALIAMGAVTTGLAVRNAKGAWTRDDNKSTLNSINRISGAYQDEASKRFAASERSQKLSFFLTMQDQQRQLIGINLETGEEVGTVPMAEKQPQFMVDALGRRVYHFEGNGTLNAYEF